MAKPKRQVVGGGKETQLVIVDGLGLEDDPQQATVQTPQEAEQQYYRELLKGFFATLAKWQAIFKESDPSFDNAKAEEKREWKRRVEVVQTQTGLVINHLDWRDYEKFNGIHRIERTKPDPNRVLNLTTYNSTNPGNGLTYTNIGLTTGIAGEHLIVDPDNKPLKRVCFSVVTSSPPFNETLHHSLTIEATSNEMMTYISPNDLTVSYVLEHRKLTVKPNFNSRLMPDSYATHLLNTIDALIPDSTNPFPQPERRATHELRSPMKLHAPGRRRTQ
jgi:hypothetical protein